MAYSLMFSCFRQEKRCIRGKNSPINTHENIDIKNAKICIIQHLCLHLCRVRVKKRYSLFITVFLPWQDPDKKILKKLSPLPGFLEKYWIPQYDGLLPSRAPLPW